MQVSTSGRLIQLNANLRLEEQKSNILDDDGAEQEQQENGIIFNHISYKYIFLIVDIFNYFIVNYC